MSNEPARDLVKFIEGCRSQSGLTLLEEMYGAHQPRTAENHAATIAAHLAVFGGQSDDYKYVDLEVTSEDGLTSEGTILAITRTLILKLVFATPNNVNEQAEVTTVARRRADITSVTVSGATAPVNRDDRWPAQVAVVVAGETWKVSFPRRPTRDDTLGKLIPELLG